MQVSRHKVITKLLEITLKIIIKYFLSMNLQRTLKALGGIGGVVLSHYVDVLTVTHMDQNPLHI